MATKDEIHDALQRSRNVQLASLLTLMIGLAAEEYPEHLREALSQVFDLSAVDLSIRRMNARLQLSLELEQQLRHDIEDLRRQLEKTQGGLPPNRNGVANGH